MLGLNIAQNQDTVFISIDKNNFSQKYLLEINDYLASLFNSKFMIPPVSDEEQADIESSLKKHKASEKKIAYSETIRVSI